MPLFFSWEGVIAICSSFVALGQLIDWGLRRQRKESILAKLRNAEERLKNIPFASWQILIAHIVIDFWEELKEWPRVLRILLEEADGYRGIFDNVFYYIFFYIGPIAVILVVLFWDAPWYIKSLAPAAVIIVVYLISKPMRTFIIIISRIFRINLNRCLVTMGEIYPIAILSVVASIGALAISKAMTDKATVSYWYTLINGQLEFTHPILLSAINLPFDFLTVYVSYKLLQIVVRKGKMITIVAAIDLLLSAVLMAGLYLLLWSVDTFVLEAAHLTDITRWLRQIAVLDLNKAQQEWPLTPLMLTTFIPVAIYMSVIVLLGFVLQPIARFAGYVAGLLGEKENTPFLELAIVLSTVTAALKSLSEWGWLTQKVLG